MNNPKSPTFKSPFCCQIYQELTSSYNLHAQFKQIRNLQDWIGAIAAEILNGEDGIDGLFTKHRPNEPAARNPQIKSSQGIDSRKREKTGLVRKTVQEVIVGAKSEEIMDALNWSAFKDRPLPAEKRYHY